jgi:hypothetical protein
MKIVHDNRPAAEEFAENFSETTGVGDLFVVATGTTRRVGLDGFVRPAVARCS